MGSVVHTSGSPSRDALNLLGDAGNIIASERDAETGKDYYFYNKDIRASTTSILDSSGNCANSYEYSDFGETTVHGDLYNEICYTGGIYDETTGLYYLNARYYNPADKRFLTEDTYRGSENDPNTLHLYAYCANNPVNYVDPSGHYAEALWVATGTYRVVQGAAAVGAFVVSPTGVVLVITALICVTVYQGVKYYKVKAKKSSKSKAKGTKTSQQTKGKSANKKVEAVRKGISNKLLDGNGKVDLSKFNTKLPNGQGFKGPDGWRIVKDRAVNASKMVGHGGSFWKLMQGAKKRIATLAKDGTILRY